MDNQKPSLLPPGVWIYFKHLPRNTSPEQFQQFLADHAIDIPLENINVMNHFSAASAVASIPRSTVIALVSWALNNDAISPDMQPVVAEKFGSKAKRNGK